MTIWERVKTALTGLNVPMAADLYIPTGGELPDLFLVYNLVASTPEVHADNGEVLRSQRVQVTIYNRNGLASIPDVDGSMTAAGFQKSGMRSLPYSRETRHFGLAKDFIFLEEE